MVIIFHIIEKYNNLTRNQKKVVVLLIVLVLLIISTSVLKIVNKNTRTTWKYNSFDSVSEMLYKGETTKNNRKLYWEMKEIINNFLATMEDIEFDSENITNRTDLSDYYQVVSKEYKRKLNKSKFEDKSKQFISRFLQEDHLGNKYVDNFAIKNIYLFDDNKYICDLKLYDSDDTIGYIGIELNEKKAKFSIFYIE